MDNYIDYIETKRKIRKLKKIEIRIRFGDERNLPNSTTLVWNDFFNLDDKSFRKAKYSINDIATMSKSEYHEVVNEFFYTVYYKLYNEYGITQQFTYDPEILAHLGLKYNAGYDDIKKKFRELSKKYHPDNGGDSSDFIKLTESYNKLLDK